MMKGPILCRGKEPGDENERSLEQQKGIPSVAEADSYVHHCCALLVGNYQSQYFVLTGKHTLSKTKTLQEKLL